MHIVITGRSLAYGTVASLLGGTLAIVLAAFGLWASNHGADAGDAVGFVGAAAGTAGAIFGARWLEHAKRRDEQLTKLAQVREALLYLKRQASLHTDVTKKIGVANLSFSSQKKIFDALISSFNLDDPAMYARLVLIQFWIGAICDNVGKLKGDMTREALIEETCDHIKSLIKVVDELASSRHFARVINMQEKAKISFVNSQLD